jgi:hypothetical protein
VRHARLSSRGQARLAGLNGRLLRLYSARCLRAVPLPLGAFAQLLALNVDKEATKDALAIARAAELPALLARARQIDEQFLARLRSLPLLRLRIRYEEIEPIRAERLQQLLDVSARLLAEPWAGVRRAARAHYGRDEFEAILRRHLRLYASEVDALGRSVRLGVLLVPLRQRLAALMQEQAGALAREVCDLLYDGAMR